MGKTVYVGNELEIFKEAVNWKNYWLSSAKEHVRGDVLEVGAGLGINSKLILDNCPKLHHLTVIEPDESLSRRIIPKMEGYKGKVEVKTGYLMDVDRSRMFDTIVYIDVLEHIELDKEELALAQSFLKPGGKIVILVPAFNFLFSPFDEAIGHYRRYNKSSLQKVIPVNLQKVALFYLDSMGLMASIANKYFLKQKYPSQAQIIHWDRFLVRLSIGTDKLLFHSLGKSLIGVWKK